MAPKWDRFDYYARRIHHLNHRNKGERISADSLIHLISCIPAQHGPLLPNLQQITCGGIDDRTFCSQLLPFLSPSLRALAVCMESLFRPGEVLAGGCSRMLRSLAGRAEISLFQLDLRYLSEGDPTLTTTIASTLR